MRILVVSNLYPPIQVGGYERRCAGTVQLLEREHEVLVLTSRRGRRSVGADSRVLRVLPLLPEDWRGTVCAPLASLYAALATRRLVRRLRPDLVFVWNASQIPHAAVCVAHDFADQLAFSVADTSFAGFVQDDQFLRYLLRPGRGVHRIWGAIARLINRLPGMRIRARATRPASIAWNSQALRRLTPVPASVAPVRERVIYPAPRHGALFAGVARAPSPCPTIGFVGRLESQKAPDVAVRALALLRDRHGIDARLSVIGSGDRTDVRALEQLIATLELVDRVELRGQLPPQAVAEALAHVHALVVPSRWQEPFGLVCLEGALARVPVVASFSGGMPEMLQSETEALFFPIDDVEACAAALARTLTDDLATAERVGAAFKRAGTYSMRRYQAEYEAFVRDAGRR